MARTTGPILAIGGITLVNQSIVHGKPVDWRVPIAAGIAASLFGLAEKASAEAAVGVAYLALVTMLFARTQKDVPSPVESFNDWWNGGKK